MIKILDYILIVVILLILTILSTGGFVINIFGVKLSLTKLDVPILLAIGLILLRTLISKESKDRTTKFSNISEQFRNWRYAHPEIFYPLLIFFISRIAVFLVVYSGLILSPPDGLSHSLNALTIIKQGLFQWDSGWYKSIVEVGYYLNPTGESNVAFFPVYPITIRCLNFFYHNTELWGILISNFAFLLALIFLYKLIVIKTNAEIARKTLLLISIFPFSFFFSAVYSESTFLLVSVLTFYYLEKLWYLRASLFAGLTAITRPTGVMIIPAFIIHYLIRTGLSLRGIKKDLLVFLIIPLIASLYPFYLYFKFGDFFAFMTAERVGWGRFIKLNHLKTIGASIANIFTLNFHPANSDLLFALYGVFLVVSLFLLKGVMKTMGLHYLIYSLSLILLVALTNLEGTGRYLSVIFPLFVALASISEGFVFESIIIIFSVLLALFTFLFSHGAWIT